MYFSFYLFIINFTLYNMIYFLFLFLFLFWFWCISVKHEVYKAYIRLFHFLHTF